MKCPNCGLFHPSRYQQCVSCGTKLDGSAPVEPEAPPPPARRPQPVKPAQARAGSEDEELQEEEEEEEEEEPRRPTRAAPKGGKPLAMALVVCAGILLACAGGTYFFLTRPPEYERLLNEGKAQLRNAQYALAKTTLEQATAIKPNDPRILLTLARAYVGCDQVEKAWSCISRAQQNGAGVMSDPQLSSDLANYYRQRNQYQRAAELLRPLAEQNIAKKKSELSDLLALWGDEAFRDGKHADAVKCWEEIKTLGEGTRFQEADSRLASIYQKLATEALAKQDDEGALNFYNKLNVLAPSQASFEKTSDLYARAGKLDLAIDQLRRSIKFGSGSQEMNKKLAGLLARRGKELLDKGDADTGYAYMQQAQGLDPKVRVPTVAIRGIQLQVDPSGTINAIGEVWNPGPNNVNYLGLRGELVDTKTSTVIWRREQTVVDEFMPPMTVHETKPFNFYGACPAHRDGELELKVYMDGVFYASYPVKGAAGGLEPTPVVRRTPVVPQEAPEPAPDQAMPQPAPDATASPSTSVSPEERTLRDLE